MCRALCLCFTRSLTLIAYNSSAKRNLTMTSTLKKRIIEVCDKKIEAKGSNVGLSFYAFFANKNDNPRLLMEAATWWIETYELNHFEKALKIKGMMDNE